MSFKTNHITDKFKRTFVFVRNRAESEKAQKLMFSMGFVWHLLPRQVVTLFGHSYIYVDADNRMAQSSSRVEAQPYTDFAERSMFQLERAEREVKAIRKARKKDQRKRKALISAGWIKNTGEQPEGAVAEVRFNCGDTSASQVQWSWSVTDSSYSISHYKPFAEPVTLEAMVEDIVVAADGVEVKIPASTTPDVREVFDSMISEMLATPTEAIDTNPKKQYGITSIPLEMWPDLASAYGALGLYNGSLKYGKANFANTPVEASIYIAAARRHLAAWVAGEEFDPADGVPNLGGVLANIAILLEARAAGTLIDDRMRMSGYLKERDSLKAIVPGLQTLHAGKTPKHYTLEG